MEEKYMENQFVIRKNMRENLSRKINFGHAGYEAMLQGASD